MFSWLFIQQRLNELKNHRGYMLLEQNIPSVLLKEGKKYGLFQGRTDITYITYRDAEQELNLILAKNSSEINALVIRGAIYFYLFRYEESIKDLTASLVIKANNSFALIYRGAAHCRLKNYTEAERDLVIVAAAAPHNIFVLTYLGVTYFHLNNYHAAEHNLNIVLAANPHNAVALSYQGAIHTIQCEYDKAEVALTTALSIDDKNIFTLLHLAETYHLSGNHDQGLAIADSTLVFLCEDVELLMIRAKCFLYNPKTRVQGRADLDKALSLVNQQLATKPTDVQLLINKGLIHCLLGNRAPALMELNKVLDTTPNSCALINGLFARSDIYALVDDYNNALIDIERILIISPQNNSVVAKKAKLIREIEGKQKSELETNVRIILNHSNHGEIPALLRRFLEQQFITLHPKALVSKHALEVAAVVVKIQFNEYFLRQQWAVTLNSTDTQRLNKIESFFYVVRMNNTGVLTTFLSDITTTKRHHRHIFAIKPRECTVPEQLFTLAEVIMREKGALSMLAECLTVVGSEHQKRCVQLEIIKLKQQLQEIIKINEKIYQANKELSDLLVQARVKLSVEVLAQIEAQKVSVSELRVQVHEIRETNTAITIEATELDKVSTEISSLHTAIAAERTQLFAREQERETLLQQNHVFIQKTLAYLANRLKECTSELTDKPQDVTEGRQERLEKLMQEIKSLLELLEQGLKSSAANNPEIQAATDMIERLKQEIASIRTTRQEQLQASLALIATGVSAIPDAAKPSKVSDQPETLRTRLSHSSLALVSISQRLTTNTSRTATAVAKFDTIVTNLEGITQTIERAIIEVHHSIDEMLAKTEEIRSYSEQIRLIACFNSNSFSFKQKEVLIILLGILKKLQDEVEVLRQEQKTVGIGDLKQKLLEDNEETVQALQEVIFGMINGIYQFEEACEDNINWCELIQIIEGARRRELVYDHEGQLVKQTYHIPEMNTAECRKTTSGGIHRASGVLQIWQRELMGIPFLGAIFKPFACFLNYRSEAFTKFLNQIQDLRAKYDRQPQLSEQEQFAINNEYQRLAISVLDEEHKQKLEAAASEHRKIFLGRYNALDEEINRLSAQIEEKISRLKDLCTPNSCNSRQLLIEIEKLKLLKQRLTESKAKLNHIKEQFGSTGIEFILKINDLSYALQMLVESVAIFNTDLLQELAEFSLILPNVPDTVPRTMEVVLSRGTPLEVDSEHRSMEQTPMQELAPTVTPTLQLQAPQFSPAPAALETANTTESRATIPTSQPLLPTSLTFT